MLQNDHLYQLRSTILPCPSIGSRITHGAANQAVCRGADIRSLVSGINLA